MAPKSLLFGVVGAITVAGSVYLALRGTEIAVMTGALIALGIIIIVLPHLPPLELGFGAGGVTVKLQQENAQLKQDIAGERASKTGLQKLINVKPAERAKVLAAAASQDTQHGKFGGRWEVNHRKLTATVSSLANGTLGKLHIEVRSTDAARPLSGEVTFHLHETFKPEDVQTVPVNAEGVAQIELISWGAFTVGAEADGGGTKLELDLAGLPTAFDPWKKR
jgi:hypothetical protein